MNTYLLRLNLARCAQKLSTALNCSLTVGDVRGILAELGAVESPYGWLANDLRPLLLLTGCHGQLFRR